MTSFPLLRALVAAALVVVSAGCHTQTHPLNDTGITWSGHATSGNATTCDPAHPAGQDCHYGRDAQAAAGTLTKIGGGEAGFDFTALDASGQPTTPTSGANPHPCVRDNVTGLIWEVKTDDGGLRDKDHSYTWYDSVNNYGGNPGTASGGNYCFQAGRCDTEIYVTEVNTVGLCGYRDWRMPTDQELFGIVHRGRVIPAIDTRYFPNTRGSWFWSGSPDAYSYAYGAWGVHFSVGVASGSIRSDNGYVRLVRGGQ